MHGTATVTLRKVITALGAATNLGASKKRVFGDKRLIAAAKGFIGEAINNSLGM